MNETIYKALRKQIAALLPDLPLHRIVEQSTKHLHTKGLQCLNLLASDNVMYQAWLAWPGTTKHNAEGFAFAPTRALYDTQVAVVAGSVAFHRFSDAPNAEFLDDTLIADGGYHTYQVHEVQQVIPALQYETKPDLAVVKKETDTHDSGEGFHIAEGLMATMSFDQNNFTLLLVKSMRSEHAAPLFILTPEGEQPDYSGLYQKPTRDEVEHWMEMLENYFPR